MKRKQYENPATKVVEIEQRGMLMQSGEARGAASLGDSYTNDGSDAWGSGSGTGGSSMGGWTNTNSDPWK